MKVVIDKAESRGYADHNWLKTYHTFSFANYDNPERIHFGALRVLNDDTVAPGFGFDMHPHKNMEVISIPLKGSLRHGDSIQSSEVITPGDIQVMSAGSGIYHSEYNDSEEETVEFLQIWVFPRRENTEPRYHSFDIRPAIKQNDWSLIISPEGDAPASIFQDAWFTLGKLEEGITLPYTIKKEVNGVYIFVIEGEIMVNDFTLHRRDGGGFSDTGQLYITTRKESYILLIDVPME
ncbi:MAG: pirin family protein [Tannerellaceae bacterium]|nr:pirin family protein [Tannerellaceae bacterium]